MPTENHIAARCLGAIMKRCEKEAWQHTCSFIRVKNVTGAMYMVVVIKQVGFASWIRTCALIHARHRYFAKYQGVLTPRQDTTT